MSAPPINLELFGCAGGMAEGFRRAGIGFDMTVDIAPDHCDSYEANLGHRPVQMDVRDLLRMAQLGWHVDVDLLVADPPCTPWSRAGKRLGTADERDMLEVTCQLIEALRPRRYLIGNVPGLDDSGNLPVVQRLIGGLSAHGYCTRDFARLDASAFGVPQVRIRPFWFGHREGRCLRWPAATHVDPTAHDLRTLPMLGERGLLPWVTCRQALGHLSGDDLGRPVKLRKLRKRGQLGSVPDRPARVVVGTSNLSDGDVLTRQSRHRDPVHTSELDSPARTITPQCRAPGHATTLVLAAPESGRKRRPPSTRGPQSSRVGSGSPVLEWPWPWDRPATTVTARAGLAPPGHHDENFAILSLPDAIILSERAAAILQGFPDPGAGGWRFCGATKKARWSQIGQAMPPALAEAVARAIVEQDQDPPSPGSD